MLVFRCTQKLLKRIGPPVADPPESTTALGEWYAQPLAVGHQRYVLLVSERSRLPVLMPERDVKHLAARFPAALARVLASLGVPEEVIARELAEAGEIVIAKTASRGHASPPRVRSAGPPKTSRSIVLRRTRPQRPSQRHPRATPNGSLLPCPAPR